MNKTFYTLVLICLMLTTSLFSKETLNIVVRTDVKKYEQIGKIEAQFLNQDGSSLDLNSINILENWLRTKNALIASQSDKNVWPWREINTRILKQNNSLNIISEIVKDKYEINETLDLIKAGVNESFHPPIYDKMTKRYLKNCFYRWYGLLSSENKMNFKLSIVKGTQDNNTIKYRDELIGFYIANKSCILDVEPTDQTIQDLVENYNYGNNSYLTWSALSPLLDGFYDKLFTDLKMSLGNSLLDSLKKSISKLDESAYAPDLAFVESGIQFLKTVSSRPITKCDYMFYILSGLREEDRNILFLKDKALLLKSKYLLNNITDAIMRHSSSIYTNNQFLDSVTVLINLKRGNGTTITDLWFK